MPTQPDSSSATLPHSSSIVIDSLSKSFGHKTVLHQLNLKLCPQESFVLLGASGSGKSVLLKCLLGILPIDQGTIWFNGQSIAEETNALQQERMRKVGMVFQGSALFDSLSVWENVSFSLIMNQGIKKHQARHLALEKLKAVGLEPEVADCLPSELSGGMKRRVALARAVALSPQFLFLDEPTAGLDPVFSRLIASHIQNCRKTLKATTFTITHDLSLARHIADRIGFLYNGCLLWQGSVEELSHTGIPEVENFISS